MTLLHRIDLLSILLSYSFCIIISELRLALGIPTSEFFYTTEVNGLLLRFISYRATPILH